MAETHKITGLFPDVIDQLKSEHRPGFVYRGQIREWPGPLVPSLFRPFVPTKTPFDYIGENRLRKTGVAFIEEYSPQDAMAKLKPEQLSVVQRRMAVSQELRNTFGYLFCQVMSQQAGLNSEGLDVTNDINVAAYFATHQFVNDSYIPVTTGEGIIYRFSVDISDMTLADVNHFDFYSCPPYLSSFDMIQLFGMCLTVEESIHSLMEYRAEHFAHIAEDQENARRIRPFDAIKFPAMSRYYSRIVQQHAGLLIPDMILSDFWSTIEVPAPQGKTTRAGQPCLEDLSKRPGTSIFRFQHNPDNANSVNIVRDMIFRDDDIICSFLRVLLSRVFGAEILLFRDSILFATNPDSDLVS